MKKLFVIMIMGVAVACNNNSTDSDKTTTDSSTMTTDTTNRMMTDTSNKMMTDTSIHSKDTVTKK